MVASRIHLVGNYCTRVFLRRTSFSSLILGRGRENKCGRTLLACLLVMVSSLIDYGSKFCAALPAEIVPASTAGYKVGYGRLLTFALREFRSCITRRETIVETSVSFSLSPSHLGQSSWRFAVAKLLQRRKIAFLSLDLSKCAGGCGVNVPDEIQLEAFSLPLLRSQGLQFQRFAPFVLRLLVSSEVRRLETLSFHAGAMRLP